MKGETAELPASTIAAMHVVKKGRLFFAHKSVGDNIIAGLKSLADQTGIRLSIRELNNESAIDSALFAHSQNGENGNPVSKVDAFEESIKSFGTLSPQIAFMKFCYVDFKPDSDATALLSYYKAAIERLRKERPDITFVHLTAPLSTRSDSWKNRIKRLLGIQTWDDGSNIKRAKFNAALFQAFPDDHIFDIARIESTYPDGSREYFVINNKTYFSMVPAYALDDGHLNDSGQRLLAEEMVLFLAGVLHGDHTKQ